MQSIGSPEPADYEELVRGAREAAEELLERFFGLTIEKALDLHTRAGFDTAVARLAAELRRVSASADAEALRVALRVLDVDWRSTPASVRRELVDRAMSAAKRATGAVPNKVTTVFGRKADEILRATRRDGRGRQHLSIGANFNAIDRRIIRHAATSQSLFVTDEYGRRHEEAAIKAREVVALGLEHGLGRDEIATNLQDELGQVLVGRGAGYWQVVASSFTANTRSLGQMSSFAEAGIQRYRISAVLDEATTDTCRFLNGKIMSVRTALERFDLLERMTDPAEIRSAAPWVRVRIDAATSQRQLFVRHGGGDSPVARVRRSGVGRANDPGEFMDAIPDDRLEELGVGFPPYHGHCRSTTVPEFAA